MSDKTPDPKSSENGDAQPGESQPSRDASPSIRLQRFLAQCGLGARRECEALVTSGRVTVDGKSVTELGTKVDPKRQDIRLDGEKLKPQQRQTWVFNKPPGVLCTMKDPQNRPRVVDFFPASGPRLFTVGRLDESSTGLIIVTNDGDLAQKLAHPKYRIYRTYHVQVAGIPGRDALTAVKQGLWFAEGKFRVQSAKVLKRQGRSTVLEVVLREGQNREVRRLFDRAGHKVLKLKRVAFGPIRLGSLSMGKFRPVTTEEMTALRGILERNQRPPGPDDESRSERPRRRSGKPPHRSVRQQHRRDDEAFKLTEADDRPRRPTRHPASGKRRRRVDRRPLDDQSTEGQTTGSRRSDRRPASGQPAVHRRTGGRPTERRRGMSRRPQETENDEGQGRFGRRNKSRGQRPESGEAQSKRPFRPRRPGKPRPPGKSRPQSKRRRPGRRESGEK